MPVEPLHLILGGEELLVERAVAEILRAARASAGTDDVPVDHLRAGDVSTNELAELLSPSLFADERVVVLDAADEAGKDAVALIDSAAADLPPGTVLVVVHSGGGRAKALAGQLRERGAQTHPCAKIAKAGTPMSVGDERACSQLFADTGGAVDADAVRRYHSGKAEVTGFDIADKAVLGDIPGATEALRWAMLRGVAHVLIADALAEAIHAIARVGPLSGDPYRLAGEIGMPPWKIQKAQKQSRRWSRETVATAIRLVAALNADVKGAAADADYVLESAVRRIAELASGGGR